jgi:hypothetical protein
MRNHVCAPGTAQAAGNEYRCACGARWVAVRQRWWSRGLRWERVLFALPPDRAAAPRRNRPQERA